MGLLDFIERGPERTEWLSDTIGGAVEYLTPPNLRPVVEMAAQFNPIQGMADSMTQFGVAMDPARSMDERRAAAMGSAVEGLLAVVPAAMASQGYMKPVQASMEGLLGWSPAGQAVGDELGRFVRSEGGSIGFDPVTQRGDEILDLLKRDPMRVTDEMLDMGADTPRLNEYLFRNYDLPMDQASRMARAEDMGFGGDWYHGGVSDFPAFSREHRGSVSPSISSKRATWAASNPDVAEGYVNLAEGGDVQRLIEASYRAEADGSWDLAHDLMAEAEALEASGRVADGGNIIPLMAPEYALRFDALGEKYDASDYVLMDKVNEAQRGGFDAVRIDNFVDNPDYSDWTEADHIGVFDPTNIRSRFARFDPRLSHLKNLSAGIGAAGLFGLLSPQEQQGGI